MCSALLSWLGVGHLQRSLEGLSKNWEVRIRNAPDLRGGFKQLTPQVNKSEAQRSTNGRRSLMQSIHILHLYAHYLLTTAVGFAHMRK